jgi:hypothetical protein
MRIASLVFALAFIGVASAEPMRPIWESHPRLLCRGETYVRCDLQTNTCASDQSRAVFSVDFVAGTVTTFGGEDHPERIIGRTHFESDIEQMRSFSSVYTDGAGRVMSFGAPSRAPGFGARVRATMTNAGAFETLTHSLQCAPA